TTRTSASRRSRGQGSRDSSRRTDAMSLKLSRAAYAGHYGPTAGDRIRLADTEIVIEVEKDFTVYGDEVQFGGGKVIRDSQGQSPLPPHPQPLPPAGRQEQQAQSQLHLVFSNAVVVDNARTVKGA